MSVCVYNYIFQEDLHISVELKIQWSLTNNEDTALAHKTFDECFQLT